MELLVLKYIWCWIYFKGQMCGAFIPINTGSSDHSVIATGPAWIMQQSLNIFAE